MSAIAWLAGAVGVALGMVIASVAMLTGRRVPDAVPQQVSEPDGPPRVETESAAVWRKRLKAAHEEADADRRRAVLAILPVLDDLERARAHGDLTAGVIQIIARFDQALQEVGVFAVEAEPGRPFDPRRHEAVAMMSTSGGDLRVIEVVRRGFAYAGGGKLALIRPALVVVARAGEPS